MIMRTLEILILIKRNMKVKHFKWKTMNRSDVCLGINIDKNIKGGYGDYSSKDFENTDYEYIDQVK